MNDAAMTRAENENRLAMGAYNDRRQQLVEAARFGREHPIQLRLIQILGLIALIAFGVFLSAALP